MTLTACAITQKDYLNNSHSYRNDNVLAYNSERVNIHNFQHMSTVPTPEFFPHPPDVSFIFRYLCDNEQEVSEAAMCGDKDRLERIIDAAVKHSIKAMCETIKKESQNKSEILRPLQESLLRVADDVPEIDRIIADVPEITRDGFTLVVKGKLGIYRIALWHGGQVATCFQEHFEPLSVCIEGDGDIEEIGKEWGIGEETKRSVQIALGLVDETELKDLFYYRDINRIVMCLECYREGTISNEAVDALAKMRDEGDGLRENGMC